MKILKYILVILLFPAVSSFDTSDVSDTDFLYQKWIYVDSNENGMTYKSAKSWDSESGGMEFFKDGRLIVRQNSGWCGTPPISYGNFSGSWERVSEETIKIENRFWGGTTVSNLYIVSLSKNELVLKQELVEMIKDDK